MGFVLLLIIGLSALMFFLVSQIFNSLAPGMRTDLEWKARRGAAELVQTAELGMVSGDRSVIDEATVDYRTDRDVSGLLVMDAQSTVLLRHGLLPETPAELVSGPRGGLRETAQYMVSWNEAVIEGAPVGRVAVVVWKRRG